MSKRQHFISFAKRAEERACEFVVQDGALLGILKSACARMQTVEEIVNSDFAKWRRIDSSFPVNPTIHVFEHKDVDRLAVNEFHTLAALGCVSYAVRSQARFVHQCLIRQPNAMPLSRKRHLCFVRILIARACRSSAAAAGLFIQSSPCCLLIKESLAQG